MYFIQTSMKYGGDFAVLNRQIEILPGIAIHHGIRRPDIWSLHGVDIIIY